MSVHSVSLLASHSAENEFSQALLYHFLLYLITSGTRPSDIIKSPTIRITVAVRGVMFPFSPVQKFHEMYQVTDAALVFFKGSWKFEDGKMIGKFNFHKDNAEMTIVRFLENGKLIEV